MERFVLNASLRENSGVRSSLANLRKNGMIPAVIYGGNEGSVNIAVSMKDFVPIFKTARNSLITLRYNGKEDIVVIKDIQRHVVSDDIIHVDFHRISMDRKIDIKVPLKFVGEAYGIKVQGGIAEYDMREVTVRCYPKDIPHEIVVDISNLKIGDSIRIKDLKAENFEIRENPENLVISIISPVREEATVSVSPTIQQPEVIGKGKEDKGETKKQEEGGKKPSEGAKK